MSLYRLLLYLWVLPTTAVGLLFVLATFITGGRVRVIDGVIEAHGRAIRFFLSRCIPLRGGASAMTLGHVVIGRDQTLLDFTRRHERIHVRQCERWGPLFIPAYFAASLFILCRGGRMYEDNPFEREAYNACGGLDDPAA